MTWRLCLLSVLCVVAVLLTRPAAAQDWQLVDANTINEGSYLILTIPRDEPAALAALADTLEADFGVPLAAEWPLAAINVHCFVFDARQSPDVQALIDAMEADDRIRTVQRIRDFNLSETPYPDPLFPLQWALEQLNILAAHQASRGDGVRVGIVDSAIDTAHPDLAERVADARDFVARRPVALAEAHGTAVAGVIGATATNDGIVGVAPEAELVGLRACWQVTGEGGVCNSFSLARAINFAILNDIDVLNLSIGGPDDPLLTELIQAALDKGIVVVAASGEGTELVYPAALDGVIAAGQVPSSVPAPMVDVLSTAPGAEHRYVSGSSIATAHVSGVVALMLAAEPGLSPAAVAERLTGAVLDAENRPMLDACKALLANGAACRL